MAMPCLYETIGHFGVNFVHVSDGRYYRKSIEIIDTYKIIDTFDTRKKYW
jgi:hypothetical protein